VFACVLCNLWMSVCLFCNVSLFVFLDFSMYGCGYLGVSNVWVCVAFGFVYVFCIVYVIPYCNASK